MFIFSCAAFFYSFFSINAQINPQAGLTAQEEQEIAGIEEELDKQNPETAKECLSAKKPLIEKLKSSDHKRASEIEEKAHAVKDISELISQSDKDTLRSGLITRLDRKKFQPHIIKAFNLKWRVNNWEGNIPPELLLPWVEKRYPQKVEDYKIAVFSLEYIETSMPEFAAYLKQKGIDKNRWNSYGIVKRARTGYDFVNNPASHENKKAEKEQNPEGQKLNELAKLSPKAGIDLFNNFFDSSGKYGGNAKAPAALRPAGSSGVHAMAAGETSSTQPPGKPAEITKEDWVKVAGPLKTALIKEIADTHAGQFILESLRKDGWPAVKIDKGKFIAAYSLKTKEIILGDKVIKEWMKTHSYSPNDLLRSDNQDKTAPIEKLARLMANSFLHEATHHHFNNWQQSKDLFRWTNPQSNEFETFTIENLFLIEKMSKQPNYFSGMESLLGEDIKRIQLFLNDPRKFKDEIRSMYGRWPSLEAESARALNMANAMRKELKRRGIDTIELTSFEQWQARMATPLIKLFGKDSGTNFDKALNAEMHIPPLANAPAYALKYQAKYFYDWHAQMEKRNEEFFKTADEMLDKILKGIPASPENKVPPPQ